LVDHQKSATSSSDSCGTAPCGNTPLAPQVPIAPGEFGDLAGCDDPKPSAIAGEALPLRQCQCEIHELQIRNEPGVGVQSLSIGNLLNCQLYVSADEPVGVELVDVALDNVGITLTGPITLHLRKAELDGVRIRSAGNDAGEPALEVESSDM
jgi:hypothetical protein